jgi:N utilization substance protein A
VGIRGVRIQAIVRELHDEKIDVIEWNPDPAVFIAKAISPARVVGVYLNDKPGGGKTATVVVPEDQLSLAIGRDGQNARLAAKLTGWRIDIKSLAEGAADAIYKLRNDETLIELAETESEIIPQIELLLAKKAEGRPLPPEEYDQMAQFVDRVEKRTAVRQEPEKKAVEDTVTEGIRSHINPELFEQSILDSSLPEHVSYIIQEAGYATVGDLILQMLRQPDDILRLQGIGPKAMAEITKLVESTVPKTAVEEPKEIETKIEPEGEAATPPVSIEAVVEVPQVEATIPESEELLLQVTPVTTEEIPVEVPSETNEVEEETPFDQLFTLKPEMIDGVDNDVDAETEEDDGTKKDSDKKKKKKKHSNIEIEYDPERDLTTVRKKHKRGDEGWTWEK